MTLHILFVCTANVCRSPMAAVIFSAEARKRGDAQRFSISSAGTWAREDDPASGNARIVTADLGLSLEGHRARTVDADMLEQSDLVLVMTRHHMDALVAEFPSARAKIHMLSELSGQLYDVGDPYGGSLEEYQVCAAELSELIAQGYPRVEAWVQVSSVQDRSPKR